CGARISRTRTASGPIPASTSRARRRTCQPRSGAKSSATTPRGSTTSPAPNRCPLTLPSPPMGERVVGPESLSPLGRGQGEGRRHGRPDMDARELLLEEHNRVHSAAVGGDKASMAERTFGGLTDQQMRVRPREDLNSLAWLMWHIARAEDIFANLLISGRDQVLDGGWAGRLKVKRPDFGIGMTKPEVAELSATIDIAALRDYRDAVGRRSREIVGAFGPGDWKGE